MRIVKSIFNVILIFIMVFIIYMMWSNQDEILSKVYNIFKFERKVQIKDANEYKRFYTYNEYSIEEDYEPHNKEDLKNIIYNFLNNGWDDFTFYCPEDYENCLDDMKELSNNSSLLSSINNYVNPFNSFNNIFTKISSDGSVNLSLERTYTEEMKNEINDKIDEIIKELKLNGLSKRKKIKLIHNYLIDNIEYDKDENFKENNSNNAYGALISNIALCSGYSDAMALFLDKLEIPNLKISSETHVWNLVYYNKKWLHLDVTWDDPINAITDSNRYVYFLITNDRLKKLDKDTHNYENRDYKETIGG